MTRTGKIARLPHAIRDQLNDRLHNGQIAKFILPWLNGLPEVRSVLKAEFSGNPISAVNLTEWKNGGYRDWLVRHEALNVVRNLSDENALGDVSLNGSFTSKLAHWVAIHLAATAQTVVASERNPQMKWSRLRELCTAIYRLRSGDYDSERLTVNRQWLALEQSKTDPEREKQFWEWVQRPDIREKLLPDDAGPGLSEATITRIEKELRLM